MTSKWVAERFQESVHANMKMPVGQLLQNIDQQFNCEITRNKGYKALAISRANIRGSVTKQYVLIGKYVVELQKTHPNILLTSSSA